MYAKVTLLPVGFNPSCELIALHCLHKKNANLIFSEMCKLFNYKIERTRKRFKRGRYVNFKTEFPDWQLYLLCVMRGGSYSVHVGEIVLYPAP